MVAAAIGAGAAVVGVGSSILGGMSAADQAEKAGKAARDAALLENQEVLRRQRRENRYQRQMGRALAYGSGLEVKGGTLERFLDAQYDEHVRQRSWTIAAGEARAEALEQGGQDIASQAMWQGVTGAIQGIGQVASLGAEAGWWS